MKSTAHLWRRGGHSGWNAAVPAAGARAKTAVADASFAHAPAAADALPARVASALASPGQPLDPHARRSLEPRFGHDFSSVRVHVDAAAAASVSARAFTFRDRVVFGADQYRPHTESGRHLLAHELAHVVQQRRGGDGAAGEGNEHDADRAADAALRPGPIAAVRTATAPGIARQPMDPRHARGYAGEQGMGFERYSQQEGWSLIEGPSGSAGHGVTTRGFDGIAYNPKLDELHLLDNKSLKASGNVASATAIDPARNLARNIDDAIARIRAMKDTPNRVRVLDLLTQAKDSLANGKPMPSKVRLVVTGVGGNSTGVTPGLQSRGVQFRGANTPTPGAPGAPGVPGTPPNAPGATNAAVNAGAKTVGEEGTALGHVGAPPTLAPVVGTRPSFGTAAAADARVEVELQGALGALANEARATTRISTLVKGGAAVFGMTLEAISALGAVNDALDLYRQGTVLGEAQQGAEKLRENSAGTLAEVQARWDAFPAFGNVVLEDKLARARDANGLAQLGRSLGALGDALDQPIATLNSLAKNTRARATLADKLSSMLMKAASSPIPQGVGTVQQASEFALAQSLELLGGALTTAASNYEQAAFLLTQFKGYADAIASKAGLDYLRALAPVGADAAPAQPTPKAPAARSTNAHAPSPAHLAPQPQAERDKQVNDALSRPAACPGGCHQATRERPLRERVGDDLLKFDDKAMQQWLSKKPEGTP